MRSGLLQRGNALSALGREDEARESYEKVFPLIENEPRCARVDWERHSLYVNIGNTYSRQGDFEKADEQYKIAESLGQDHIKGPGGSMHDGIGMVIVAKRNRCFALKKAGREDEAKDLMKEVIAEQMKQNALKEEQKAAAAVVAAAEAENPGPVATS
jgi:tetratricopeptide (TPR) repeat protein